MRWKMPRYGDTRTITVFLWLPITIKYERRWLERAVINQYYMGYDYENLRKYSYWKHESWGND